MLYLLISLYNFSGCIDAKKEVTSVLTLLIWKSYESMVTLYSCDFSPFCTLLLAIIILLFLILSVWFGIKHLMLLFNRFPEESVRDYISFKNILCYYSTAFLNRWNWEITDLKTSYVTIQPYVFMSLFSYTRPKPPHIFYILSILPNHPTYFHIFLKFAILPDKIRVFSI